MGEQRIDATAPPAFVWCIDPSGIPQPIPFERHQGTGVLMPPHHSQGVPMLYPSAESDGWTIMQKECTPEAWREWKRIDDAQRAPRGHGRFMLTREIVKMLPERVQEHFRYHPTCGEHVDTGAPPPSPKKKTATTPPAAERI